MLNHEQEKAIELENKLPELAQVNLEIGRKKQAERILNEMKEEDIEKIEQTEQEELKQYQELQKKYDKSQRGFLFSEFDKFTNYLSVAKIFIKYQPFCYDSHRIWWFWNQVEKKWEIVDEVDLMNAIDNNTRDPSASLQDKHEIIEALKRVGRKNKPKEPSPYWIQFKDKIYDLKTDKTFDATPEYFITNPIPHSLGSKEDTPTIDKLMKEWVVKKGVQDETYVCTLQQILAYCFLPDLPIHRIFCLIGEGLNGKGTFLRLCENFVGMSNKCATEIELLSTHRFESSKLYKKLICIAGEIDKGIFHKTKTIKSLSGEDLIRFELKGKDGFDGHSYAKILIATNHLPETTDKSKGFYRRWTIINFPNVFNEQKKVLESIPEEEYSNFCLKAIKILKELLVAGEFMNDGTIQQREDKYEKHSNFIGNFINQYCVVDENYSIEFSEFVENYNEFLISEGLKRKSKVEIGRSLLLKGFEKKVKKIYEFGNETTKLHILKLKWKEETRGLIV